MEEQARSNCCMRLLAYRGILWQKYECLEDTGHTYGQHRNNVAGVVCEVSMEALILFQQSENRSHLESMVTDMTAASGQRTKLQTYKPTVHKGECE